MATELSRKELFDLVWSIPIQKLAERFEISNVALKKTCARAEIPVPGRGYWAKKDSGKPVVAGKLPPRPPGMSDDVVVGGGGRHWYSGPSREELLGPLPPLPTFSESLDDVRARVSKAIGKVSVPREQSSWVPVIQRYMLADEQRRQQVAGGSYVFDWNKPMFESQFELRRFRLLNALFLAIARVGGKGDIRTKAAREIVVHFHGQYHSIALERPGPPNVKNQWGHTIDRPPRDDKENKISLSVFADHECRKTNQVWSDDAAGKLESKLASIAVELAVLAEEDYRAGAQRAYEWRIQRKAAIEEEDRQLAIDAIKREKESQEKLAKERIDRLFAQAASFRRAQDIREFAKAAAEAARSSNGASNDFERWSAWALAEAAKIDPVINGTLSADLNESDDSQT